MTRAVVTVFRIAVIAGAAFFFAHPVSAATNGPAVIMQSDPASGITAIDLWFRAPGDGYTGDQPGIARLAAVAVAATPDRHGSSLAERIRGMGGRFSVSVYPDITGVQAVVPADDAAQALAALRAAYFSPVITSATLRAARRDLAIGVVEQRLVPELAIRAALTSLLYASGPAHDPPIPGDPSLLTGPSVADVTAFAKRAFRPENTVIAMAGDVTATATTAAGRIAGDGGDAPFDSTPAAAPVTRTVAASVNGIGLGWIGPPIADEKAATAMDFIADTLFRPETGVVAKTVRRMGLDAEVDGQFVTTHGPGALLVTISGPDAEKAAAIATKEIAALRAPMDAARFAPARAIFIYHVHADAQTPPEMADDLGWYAAEGAPAYAPGLPGGSYDRIAEALDPATVASVAARYLGTPFVVHLVAERKGGVS
jgi:predicted Zn-dependent peptidase